MPFLALRPAPNVLDPWVTHKVSVDSPSKSATVSLKPAQDKAKGGCARVCRQTLPRARSPLEPFPNATAGRTSFVCGRRTQGLRPKLLLAHLSQTLRLEPKWLRVKMFKMRIGQRGFRCSNIHTPRGRL